jgi:hypothetical protein
MSELGLDDCQDVGLDSFINSLGSVVIVQLPERPHVRSRGTLLANGEPARPALAFSDQESGECLGPPLCGPAERFQDSIPFFFRISELAKTYPPPSYIGNVYLVSRGIIRTQGATAVSTIRDELKLFGAEWLRFRGFIGSETGLHGKEGFDIDSGHSKLCVPVMYSDAP